MLAVFRIARAVVALARESPVGETVTIIGFSSGGSFGLIAAALLIVLVATLQDSTELQTVGGYVVFTFAALGCYLFFHVMSLATGGRGLPLGHPVLGR